MTGFRPLSLILFLAVVGFGGAPCRGQGTPDAEAAAPDIHGVLANSRTALDRLKEILDLTTPQEQEQYKTLKEYVEVFLYGVDYSKPVRMNVLSGTGTTTYRLYVPIDNFNTFWKQNLVPLGIPVRKFVEMTGVYRLGGKKDDAFDGYMLYDAKERDGYGIIWEQPTDKKAKLPPKAALDPIATVQDLLAAGNDVAVRLKNQPAGVQSRRVHYESDRAEFLGKLKRDAEETVSGFALRKFAAGMQYDETARLYAESAEFSAGLKVLAGPPRATGKMKIAPIADTALSGSIKQIGETASRFAGIPRGEKATITARINFPLDEFRKKNLADLADKSREAILEDLAAGTYASPDEAESAKKFAGLFIDLVKAGVEAGIVDGFVEMQQGEAAAQTVVGAMKVPDGKAWQALVELLPKTGRATDLKTAVAEHEGVTFHEVMLTQKHHPSFFTLFGGGRLVVGTTADSVWYAGGPNADEALKKAISDAAAPGQPDKNFLSFRGDLLPVIQVVDQRLGTRGQKKYRELAIQAFQGGEGKVNADLTRNGDDIDGEMLLDIGVLRMIGKGLSLFAKENLE